MLHGVEIGDVRAVHRTRVASRRIREILPVLQLDPDAVARLNRAVRKVTRRLGTVRELDALLVLIGELQASGRYSDEALRRIAAETRRAREAAHDDMPVRSLTSELKRVARKLESVVDKLEREARKDAQGRPWRWAIEARVARRASNLERAMNEAGALYLPERLHAVRISLKKLRYGLELSVEAAKRPREPGGRSADLALLKRGQVILGRLHDLQILTERARQVEVALNPAERGPRRELDRLIVAVEQQCRRLHGRYVRERRAISAICDRLIARSDRSVGQLRAKRAG
jgi:CHAD domain-containing protein